MDKKREIFIKIEKSAEIIELLKEIKAKESEIQQLFAAYDKLNLQESKIFETWSGVLEDIVHKLDHVTL